MAGRVVLKPSALPFLIVYIFRREAAWQMCKILQKDFDTFEQVVKQIEALEKPFRKKRKKLREIENTLLKEYNKPNLDYGRLKTYLECKIMEYDTDMKKWMADFLISVTKIILPVLVGATALKSDNLDFCQLLFLFLIELLISVAFVGGICFLLGWKVEAPMKKQHNKKCFYEICLKILEQYLLSKNKVDN